MGNVKNGVHLRDKNALCALMQSFQQYVIYGLGNQAAKLMDHIRMSYRICGVVYSVFQQ